ncbi:unnamed protein product [Chrysoparadoxa australica]
MRCDISRVEGVGIKDRYRYMFTPVSERSQALEKIILGLEKDMVAENQIISEITPVGVPRQEEVWCVGRICCEADQGRLNNMSVLLEGSRAGSGGQRVHLSLQAVRDFALFPGQVVAVQGMNSGGTRLVARSLIEGVPRPFPASSPVELMRYNHGPSHCGGKPLSVIVAAGPFTTRDNLEYLPLNDLLVVAKKTKPDVVILVGPFVDDMHPEVAKCNASAKDGSGEAVPLDFESLFFLRIGSKLEQLLADEPELSTQFILVPSTHDAFHDYVYPQPPFSDRVKEGVEMKLPGAEEDPVFVLGLPESKKVHCVSNPSMIKINEVTLGVTSTDVLFDINQDEISIPSSGGRLIRLTEHLLKQQSFYPLFPPPSNSSPQLDLCHAEKWHMPCTPDILLVPSRLQFFARNIKGCLCINPGQLAKGNGGGTFAHMAVHPIPKAKLEKAKPDEVRT